MQGIKTMNKSELVATMAAKSGSSQADAGKALTAFCDVVGETLSGLFDTKDSDLGFPFVSLRASLAHAKWNIHHSFVGGPSAA